MAVPIPSCRLTVCVANRLSHYRPCFAGLQLGFVTLPRHVTRAETVQLTYFSHQGPCAGEGRLAVLACSLYASVFLYFLNHLQKSFHKNWYELTLGRSFRVAGRPSAVTGQCKGREGFCVSHLLGAMFELSRGGRGSG